MFDGHFFDLPIGCDQAQGQLSTKVSLNASMRETFIVDLDVLLFNLVKAFLEHWIRWISYKASVAFL